MARVRAGMAAAAPPGTAAPPGAGGEEHPSPRAPRMDQGATNHNNHTPPSRPTPRAASAVTPGPAEYGTAPMADQRADSPDRRPVGNQPAMPAPSAEKRWTGKRTGEIKVKALRQDQVMWQPNQAFEESRWHAVRDAVP